jgi:LacI family gluconate utilization system Gnt-I transcriptional repressor
MPTLAAMLALTRVRLVAHAASDARRSRCCASSSHRPAGLIVTGLGQTAATRSQIAASGVPCVHVMETASDPGLYTVGLSQAQAASALTRHLLERGYRRIAFAAAQLDPRTVARLAGWRDALQTAGRHDSTLEWLNPAPSSLALGARMFEQVIAMQPRIDANFCCNDDLAQGALLAAWWLKVPVPELVAVAGFNDLTGSDQIVPPLTTVRTPRAQIGERAGRMLLARVSGETVAPACVDLGFELVVRGSS